MILSTSELKDFFGSETYKDAVQRYNETMQFTAEKDGYSFEMEFSHEDSEVLFYRVVEC